MADTPIEGIGASITIGSLGLTKIRTLGGFAIDGGDPLDATYLANSAWMTKLPQTLAEASDISFTMDYDPSQLAAVVTEINNNQSIVMTFSGIGTITFWGYLKSYEPDDGEKGTAWTVSCTIVPTLLNASLAETAPVFST